MDNTSENVWIIDTSYNFVDSIAFDFLLKHLKIVAVTCVGTKNNSTRSVKQNVLNHISSYDSNLKIDVYEGADQPFINYEKELGDDPIINPYIIKPYADLGADVKPSHEEKLENVGAIKILELANKHGKKLNILAMGPLTNIAIAVLIDASISEKINSLVVTGGSMNNWGNSGNAAEFNFRHDPVAAKNVIKYFQKNKIVIPLEVDREISPKIFNESVVSKMKNKTLAEKFKQVIDHLVAKGSESEFALVNFNTLSLLSSLYAINPKVLSVSVNYPSDVDIIGKLTRGILVMEKYLHVQSGNLHPTNFATFFDEKEVMELLLN